ncbi:hypothetical protein BH09ACT8_BH09ACT8_64490 [soil metagenome]
MNGLEIRQTEAGRVYAGELREVTGQRTIGNAGMLLANLVWVFLHQFGHAPKPVPTAMSEIR